LVDRLDQVSQITPGVPFEVNAETLPRMLGGRPHLVDLPAFKVV